MRYVDGDLLFFVHDGSGLLETEFGPLRYLQRLLFHTPLVYVFVFGSYFYHDMLWYPLRGRRIVEAWRRESPWGRLFSTYEG